MDTVDNGQKRINYTTVIIQTLNRPKFENNILHIIFTNLFNCIVAYLRLFKNDCKSKQMYHKRYVLATSLGCISTFNGR